MPTQLFLTETQVQAFPLAGSRRRLEEVIDGYGHAQLAGSGEPVALDEVQLAPAPVHCELPRRGHEPTVSVWGYARCSLAVSGRQVAAFSTAVSIQSRDSSEQRPSVVAALTNVGTIWTSKPIGPLGRIADGFCSRAQPDADAQPGGLNLHLLTKARSRDALEALETATAHSGPSSRQAHLPQTPARWGRVVFVNDEEQTPEGISRELLEPLTITLGDRLLTLRAYAAPRRMAGAEMTYLTIVVCGGPFEEDVAGALDALMRRSLEHALVHEWLTARAEQLNDRQAECIAELLHEDTSVGRMEDLRRQLALLRYAFVNELELTWSFELDGPLGADPACDLIDRATRLTHRWRRELTRFERLAAVTAAVADVSFLHSGGPIELPDLIPGFAEERNPFVQIGMWWRYRRQDLRSAADGAVVIRGVSGLQRSVRRRDKLPAGAREIELHPFRNRWALFEELNASIGLTSFMTAASAVFLGVILQRGGTDTLPMDVLFLFVSTFGFLFATLIYANGSGRLARHGTFGYEGQVEIANRVSEYLGVFPLLVSIPLSVSRFLPNGPIPWAVAALALTAMVAYHYLPGASLLERDISNDRIGSDWQRRYVFVPALVLLMTATYIGELTGREVLEVVGAVGFGLASLLIVLLSAMLPERSNPQEYLVDDWDVLGDETPSLFARSERDLLGVEEMGHGF